MWILGIIIFLILAVILWFAIPYSPMKAEFMRLKDRQNAEQRPSEEIFSEEDLARLPLPLQKYIRQCGFIGRPKMVNMKMTHRDVGFVFPPPMPKLKIRCTQFNRSGKPERVALIETRLYGIPFEGIDACQEGVGSMKGKLAKSVTLFDQRGEALDKSSLVNCLAESLLMPSIVLQDFMTWEAVDGDRVRGTMSYNNLSVSGIFTFDGQGLLADFTTEDRMYVDTEGNARQIPWSAVCGDYHEVSGILQPRTLQAVWHLPEGDLLYFDGHDTLIEYDVNE